MSVFLSWSGPRSLEYAVLINDWLPSVVPDVPIFFSRDIEAGRRGYDEIEGALSDCTYGICCLTPDNLESTWLHFEAGAMSNALAQRTGLKKPPVVPLLFDGLTDDLIKPPLGLFQMRTNTQQDLLDLALAVNESRLAKNTPERVRQFFDKFWPDYEVRANAIAAKPTTALPKRDVMDIVQEILEIVRSSSRGITPIVDAYESAHEKAVIIERDTVKRIAERAKANGLHPTLLDIGSGSDLIVDGNILFQVKAAGSGSIIRRYREASVQLTRSLSFHSAEEDRVFGVIVLATIDTSPMQMTAIMSTGDAVIWYNDKKFFGNQTASTLVPWLLDKVL